MTHELSIVTNDGWVITIVADKPMTLGDALVNSVIVQPQSDYDVRVGNSEFNNIRRVYRISMDGTRSFETDK